MEVEFHSVHSIILIQTIKWLAFSPSHAWRGNERKHQLPFTLSFDDTVWKWDLLEPDLLGKIWKLKEQASLQSNLNR